MQPQFIRGINSFFEDYAAALEQKDTKFMANCYAMPCTFIADDSSIVYTSDSKLEGLINQSKRFYALHNITHAEADLRNKRLISDKIVRISMTWIYKNKKNETVYDCDYYYIIKLSEDDTWKIEVAIPINEKEKIDLLNKKAAS